MAKRTTHCTKCGIYVGEYGTPQADNPLFGIRGQCYCFECRFNHEYATKEWYDGLKQNTVAYDAPEPYHPDWMCEIKEREVGVVIKDPIEDHWFDYEKYQATMTDRRLMGLVIFEYVLCARKSPYENLKIWNRRRSQIMTRLNELYSYGKDEVYAVCSYAAAYHEANNTVRGQDMMVRACLIFLLRLEQLREQLAIKKKMT
jgi:hypothetical protein